MSILLQDQCIIQTTGDKEKKIRNYIENALIYH